MEGLITSTNAAGEIVCSLEESNRLRASLGLPPLRGVGARAGPPPGAPLTITNAAGEITASVEETNKLRASLGLAPLRVGPPAASVEVFVDLAGAAAAAREAAAVAARLERSRREREELAAASRKSLGDADRTQSAMEC